MATISATSKTLIARVRQGDPAAWADFCKDYKQFIWGIIKAHGLSNVDAEDVSQNVLTGLWGKNDQGKTRFSFDPIGPAKFRTWFSKVIKNKLIDHFRKRSPVAPTEHVPFEEHEEESPNPDAAQLGTLDKERFEREFEKHWKLDVLRKALPLLERRLEPRTYQAFYLCKWEDQPPAAVAAQLGITRNAVDQMTYRCLGQLQAIIKELEAGRENRPEAKAAKRSIRKARKN